MRSLLEESEKSAGKPDPISKRELQDRAAIHRSIERKGRRKKGIVLGKSEHRRGAQGASNPERSATRAEHP